MNLPTLPTQGPSRGLPSTRGKVAASTARSRSSASADSASPAMSGTTPASERILPAWSRSPGCSWPLAPYRNSFISRGPPCRLPHRIVARRLVSTARDSWQAGALHRPRATCRGEPSTAPLAGTQELAPTPGASLCPSASGSQAERRGRAGVRSRARLQWRSQCPGWRARGRGCTWPPDACDWAC